MKRLQMTVFLLAGLFLAYGSLGCSRRKMSDRDSKKEQARINAQAKRVELRPAAGLYRGVLKQEGVSQEVSLQLEIKDVPDTAEGQVDPVLVPVLAGSMRLTFGPPEGGEYFTWSIGKADFDTSQNRIDLVLSNETLKDIMIALNRDGDHLQGTWTAPTLSSTGEIDLQRTDELRLQANTQTLGGPYSGYLAWESQSIYQQGQMTLTTKQDKPDGFSMTGSIKLISGETAGNDTLVYSFDQIEFNPLTRRINLAGAASDIYLNGFFTDGGFKGAWYSRLFGKMGDVEFKKNRLPDAPPPGILLKPFGGSYYGTFTSSSPDVHLPSRVLLSLVPSHDPERPGGLGISGNVRFYFGSFDTTEYIELPFTHLEYNYYLRNLVAKTSDNLHLTFDLKLAQGVLAGKVSDDTLGAIGSLNASQVLPESPEFSVAGDHAGILLWDNLGAYQNVVLTLIPAFSGADGLKLTATLKMLFGDAATGEQLVYQMDNVEFNSLTGFVTFKPKDSPEVTLKGHLQDGTFEGQWSALRLGVMGHGSLRKGGPAPEPPEGLKPMGPLRGSYQGSLHNDSSQTNLPERLMIGLVTSPDLDNPRGLKISGNLRFYLGPFDSNEYSEYQLADIQYDFFNRKFSAKTVGDLGLTVKGDVGPNSITGHLFHDSLGQVASFEVNKP